MFLFPRAVLLHNKNESEAFAWTTCFEAAITAAFSFGIVNLGVQLVRRQHRASLRENDMVALPLPLHTPCKQSA